MQTVPLGEYRWWSLIGAYAPKPLLLSQVNKPSERNIPITIENILNLEPQRVKRSYLRAAEAERYDPVRAEVEALPPTDRSRPICALHQVRSCTGESHRTDVRAAPARRPELQDVVPAKACAGAHDGQDLRMQSYALDDADSKHNGSGRTM